MKVWLVLIVCCLPTVVVSGEIYRWVDAAGVTHLTQDPPANAPYQRVTPDLPPSTAPLHLDGSHSSALSPPENGINKTREAGLRLKAETLERCAKAHERINFLEEKTARRLFRTGPDGQPARYSDEEFQSELKKANEAAEESCT